MERALPARLLPELPREAESCSSPSLPVLQVYITFSVRLLLHGHVAAILTS